MTIRFELKDELPIKTEASEIEWIGKNLTVKEIKKKQKNKKTGQQRVVTRQVKAKSFFSFFKSVDTSQLDGNPLEFKEEDLKQREEIEQSYEIAGVLVD